MAGWADLIPYAIDAVKYLVEQGGQQTREVPYDFSQDRYGPQHLGFVGKGPAGGPRIDSKTGLPVKNPGYTPPPGANIGFGGQFTRGPGGQPNFGYNQNDLGGFAGNAGNPYNLAEGEQLGQIPLYGPQQQELLQHITRLAQEGLLGGPGMEAGPEEQRAREEFQRYTLPSIAERYGAAGGGGSPYAIARAQAEKELEKEIYGLRQGSHQTNLQNLINQALTPQFQTRIRQEAPSAAETFGAGAARLAPDILKVLPDALKSLAGIFGGGGRRRRGSDKGLEGRAAENDIFKTIVQDIGRGKRTQSQNAQDILGGRLFGGY